MKKLISIALIFVICLSFASCNALYANNVEPTNNVESTTLAENVKFINKEITLKAGDTNTLLVNVSDKSALNWSSSNTAVAKIDSTGIVKGISKGTAIITVQLGQSTDTCIVTVKEKTTKKETTAVVVVPAPTSVKVIYKTIDSSYWLDDTSIKNELGGYSYLNGFTEWEINEMINSILAHNQYKFSTTEWFNYFSSYDWYYYDTSSMSVAESRFNSIERQNYNYLAKYRNDKF